jgi:hypothetical protein
VILPEGVTPTHLLVAQTIAGKCAEYGMELPTEPYKKPQPQPVTIEGTIGKGLKEDKTVKH